LLPSYSCPLSLFFMKLYHFTAKRFLPGIQKEGLTRGGFPLLKDGNIAMLSCCQWLTKRKGWDQAFHDPELTTLKYDRREIRLTIVIPKSRRVSLMDIHGMKRTFKGRLLSSFFYDDDCENWFVFLGYVKAQWIRRIEANPDSELRPKI